MFWRHWIAEMFVVTCLPIRGCRKYSLICFVFCFLKKFMVLFMRSYYPITHAPHFKLPCEWPCSRGSVLLQLSAPKQVPCSGTKRKHFLLFGAPFSVITCLKQSSKTERILQKCWATSQITKSVIVKFFPKALILKENDYITNCGIF